MRTLFLLLFIAIAYAFSQAATLPEKAAPTNFTFDDDQFEIGQIKRLDIIYSYDKAEITLGSRKLLDSVAIFMKCYPNLIFQIENHTDSRGNDKYNAHLTQRRAQSVVDYLIHKGIDPARMVSVGKGENELIYTDDYIKANSNNKVEQELFHQKNRRTILKIIGMDYKSQAGSENETIGNFLTPDEATLKLMLGDSITNYSISNFQKAMINESLNTYIQQSQKELIGSEKVFIIYNDANCKYKVLVFAATKLLAEPVLFGDEKNYKSFIFDECSKSWKLLD